jgi:hypothetical protein
MKQKFKQMTEISEEKCCEEFFNLVLESLRKLKDQPMVQNLEFSADEKFSIECVLRDVAARSVHTHLDTDGCVAIFEGQLKRLSEGDPNEWDNLTDLVRRRGMSMGKKFLQKLLDLQNHFQKKKALAKA